MKRFGFTVLIILLLGSYETLHAQYDTTYIKAYSDRFIIKPIFSVRSAEIELKGKFGSGFNNIKYAPNGNAYYGLGVNLFGLNFELSTKFPSSWQRSTEEFGKTHSLDIQANLYTRKIGVDFTYQLYAGFYLKDPERHNSNWQVGQPYPHRNDLIYENLHFNLFYVFNHKRYSIRSAYTQSEQQLKMAGSPLVIFSFADVKVKSNSSLFPDDSLVPTEIQGFHYADYITYAILAGYGYNFLWKNFYANLSLFVGPGIQNREIRPEFIDQRTLLTGVTSFRVGIGYNTDFFFAGVSALHNSTNTDLGELDLNVGTSNFKIFTGFRFLERGFLKRKIEF